MAEPASDKRIDQYIRQYDLERFLNRKLLEEIRLFRYDSYQTVLFEQTKVRYLYFVAEGQLKCAHYHPNGTLAVVAMLSPLNAIGDVELLDDSCTSTAVVTTRPTTLLGIPMTAIQQYGMEDPRFLRFVIGQLVSKVRDSTSLRLGNLLPVKSRLALYIMTKPGAETGGVVILPEKEVLASMLGTTYRHLNRVMKELIQEEAIGTGYPGVRVKDKGKLNRLIC